MALAFRAAQGSNNAGGGTSITMTVPGGVVNGDALLMSVATNSTASSITTPGGWTLITSNNANAPNHAIFWRAASSEPASYAVTISSDKASGVIVAFSGADTTLPGTTQRSTVANGSGTTWGNNTPAGTFTSANIATVLLSAGAVGTTWSSDGTFAGTSSPIAQSASTGGSASSRTTSIAEYKLATAQTQSGSGNLNVAAAGTSVSFLVAIFEAAAAASQIPYINPMPPLIAQ